VGSILFGKVSPLLWEIVGSKDCRYWAGWDASAAVNAFDRIDEELIALSETALVFFGVDAIDRTGVHTGGVLGADTGFCNDVCHKFSTLR
jgi:hypothetical protein